MLRVNDPFNTDQSYGLQVLIDISLTVKVATLIFVPGQGSAISSAKQGKSGSINDLVKLISFFGRTNVRAFHENPKLILTFINP